MSRNRERAARLGDNAPVFAALGDPTRLRLVARLCAEGPLSITQLSEGSGVTRQAITKHLNSLADAGLARNRRTRPRADVGARDASAGDGAALPRSHLRAVGGRDRSLESVRREVSRSICSSRETTADLAGCLGRVSRGLPTMTHGVGKRERRLAEREGFEPSVEFPLHTLSKRAPSTTRTSLRFRINDLRAVRRQIIARRRRMHASSTSPLNPAVYGPPTAARARKLCQTSKSLEITYGR